MSDFIQKRIIRRIIEQVRSTGDYPITEEDVERIIRHQAVCIANAIKNKQDVKVDFIGKFAIKEGREVALEAHKMCQELGLEDEAAVEFMAKVKKEYVINKVARKKGLTTATELVVDGVIIGSNKEVRPKTKGGYVV